MLTACTQISNNSIEAAASKYYDTEPQNLQKLLKDSVPRWDETAFGAGRDGEYEPGNNIPSTWKLWREVQS